MKVLIVEDNKLLADLVKELFEKRYTVDIVHKGKEAITQARSHRYEVIILDLNLPDVHGLTVCKMLRADKVKSSILVLTGVDDVRSRVELLNSGADDYLSKPFSSSELTARVGALIRRQSQDYVQNIIRLGDLEIDVNSREVTRAGVPVHLRRKEFDILQYLVANRGRIVSREMIISYAWESTKESWNGTVDVHIKRLRDKVDRPFTSPIIKTAYGIGYMVENA